MINIAVLVSGEGTNLQSLIDASSGGYIPGRIRIVISSRPGAGALGRAARAGIEALVIKRSSFKSAESYSGAVLEEMKKRDIDLICLAGFLVKLSGRILNEYSRRIINIHPSLLPSFGGKGMYGLKVHEAALASGAGVSGCTVHYVEKDYDSGEIIAAREVTVENDDTPSLLAERVMKQEHMLYPEVVRKFAIGALPRRDR